MGIDRSVLRESWRSWLSTTLDRRGPGWLQWVWTVLFCAAVAVGFTVLGAVAYGHRPGARLDNPDWWLNWYGRNLIVCLAVGGCIHLLFEIAGRLIGGQSTVDRWQHWQRTLFFAGIPMLGVVIGWPLGLKLSGVRLGAWLATEHGRSVLIGSGTLSLLLTFLMHQFFSIKTRQVEAERRAAEAQLRLLQGQIEPHFLFNTLANVQALMDTDPPKARQMLASFTDYLRGSLAQLRSGDSTLGVELDLAEAYLRLLAERMGERLAWQVEADDDARRVALPPLLLQPLVENAVVHGLEPRLDGGRLTLRARLAAGRLVVEVADDGPGPQAAPRPGARRGNGLALANLRERLASRYGTHAMLELIDTQPGTLARLTVPTGPSKETA